MLAALAAAFSELPGRKIEHEELSVQEMSARLARYEAVSYTHLTLPTICSV